MKRSSKNHIKKHLVTELLLDVDDRIKVILAHTAESSIENDARIRYAAVCAQEKVQEALRLIKKSKGVVK